MFKFYVVLDGDGKTIGAGKATRCRRKLEAPSLETKYKKWRTFRKHGL